MTCKGGREIEGDLVCRVRVGHVAHLAGRQIEGLAHLERSSDAQWHDGDHSIGAAVPLDSVAHKLSAFRDKACRVFEGEAAGKVERRKLAQRMADGA